MKARIALAAFAAFVSVGARAQEISGTYLSQSGDTRVRMSPCGAAFCGTIIWVKTPANDVNNPDASRRARPLVGVQMISNMKPAGGGSYSGNLYNYQDGKTYTGKATATPGGMELSGCVLGGLICRSQTWTRVN